MTNHRPGFVEAGARFTSKMIQSDFHNYLHSIHVEAIFSQVFCVFVYSGAWHGSKFVAFTGRTVLNLFDGFPMSIKPDE